MKTFLKSSLLLTLALAIAAPLSADDAKQPVKEKPAAAKASSPEASILEKLSPAKPTDEQVKSIKALVAKYQTAIEAAQGKSKAAISDEQRQAQYEAIKKAKDAGKDGEALKAAVALKLTPEQQAAIEAAQAEVKKLHGQLHEEILALLTDEQRAALKPKKEGESPKKPQSEKPAGDKKPVSKPAPEGKPAAKPAPEGKPVAKPASEGKPAAKPEGKPATKPAAESKPKEKSASEVKPTADK